MGHLNKEMDVKYLVCGFGGSRSMWFCLVIVEVAAGDRNSCGHSTCKWLKLYRWPFHLPQHENSSLASWILS